MTMFNKVAVVFFTLAFFSSPTLAAKVQLIFDVEMQWRYDLSTNAMDTSFSRPAFSVVMVIDDVLQAVSSDGNGQPYSFRFGPAVISSPLASLVNMGFDTSSLVNQLGYTSVQDTYITEANQGTWTLIYQSLNQAFGAGSLARWVQFTDDPRMSDPGTFGSARLLTLLQSKVGKQYGYREDSQKSGGGGFQHFGDATLREVKVLPAVAHDFNGDRQADLLWQNSATGARYVWFMNGTAFVGDASIGYVPLEWKIAATGDFDSDGYTDLLWHNTTTGAAYIWYMRGTTYLRDRYVGHLPSPWSIGAAADFNGDGYLDLLLENRADGTRWFWYLNDGAYASGAGLGVVASEWSIAGAVDFDGDGKADILWENTRTGLRYAWKMDGNAYVSGVSLGTVGTEFSIAALADYNGDGKPDLVWQNTLTGARYVWFMNGFTYVGQAYLGVVPPAWLIVR